jgi:hypothetical protein
LILATILFPCHYSYSPYAQTELQVKKGSKGAAKQPTTGTSLLSTTVGKKTNKRKQICSTPHEAGSSTDAKKKEVPSFNPPVPASFPKVGTIVTPAVKKAIASTSSVLEQEVSTPAPKDSDDVSKIPDITVYIINKVVEGYSGEPFNVTDKIRAQNAGKTVDLKSRSAAMQAEGSIMTIAIPALSLLWMQIYA